MTNLNNPISLEEVFVQKRKFSLVTVIFVLNVVSTDNGRSLVAQIIDDAMQYVETPNGYLFIATRRERRTEFLDPVRISRSRRTPENLLCGFNVAGDDGMPVVLTASSQRRVMYALKLESGLAFISDPRKNTIRFGVDNQDIQDLVLKSKRHRSGCPTWEG